MRLGDIVIDWDLAVREHDTHQSSRYAEAMRTGAKFPPMIVDQDSKRLVSGFHRYHAYRTVFDDPDHDVPVDEIAFTSTLEMLKFALEDNSRNSFPLTTFQIKSAIMKLKDMGEIDEEIARILGMTKERVLRFSGEYVQVGSEKKPLKGGLKHLEGKKVSPEVYNDIETKASGWSCSFHAGQILTHIRNDTISHENPEQDEILVKLYEALGVYLKGQGLEV